MSASNNSGGSKELLAINVGGTLFYTTKETVERFAPHKLSQLLDARDHASKGWLGGASQTDQPLFVDQDPALFPYVLQYLRSGHEHAAFLDDLTERQVWELYEQCRDYYSIDPLFKQLEERLFPKQTEADVKEAKDKADKATGWFYDMIDMAASFAIPTRAKDAYDKISGEVKKGLNKVFLSFYENPFLTKWWRSHTSDSKTLNDRKQNFERYKVKAETRRAWSTVAQAYLSFVGTLVLAVLPSYLFERSETRKQAESEFRQKMREYKEAQEAKDKATQGSHATEGQATQASQATPDNEAKPNGEAKATSVPIFFDPSTLYNNSSSTSDTTAPNNPFESEIKLNRAANLYTQGFCEGMGLGLKVSQPGRNPFVQYTEIHTETSEAHTEGHAEGQVKDQPNPFDSLTPRSGRRGSVEINSGRDSDSD